LTTALSIVALATLIGVSLYAQTQGQAGGQGQGQAQGQAQGQGRPQGAGRGGPPQNLQVLPKDWTGQQVQTYMRTFTAALGVECTHCHVGTMQERAKDDNPKKGIARKMILMVNAINGDLLKDVGEAPAPGAAKVTCYTCHRGAIKPLTAPAGGGH
jgi:hypothetical protein